MAITVAILGTSGDGKSTSLVINPDGKCIYLPEGHSNKATNYEGLNPETTLVLNSDRKRLPFPTQNWKNIQNVSNITDIMGEGIGGLDKDNKPLNSKLGWLGKANASAKIKSIVIDTINGIMVDAEMLESKKLTFDKWMDLAKNIYELITVCNALRDDLIIYFTGHTTIYTDVDGNESKCLVTNGRKLEKIRLESKLPIVLHTYVDKGQDGENKYYFETQKNRSTGKTPLGMFADFKIPNSLALVDDTIRKYYGLTAVESVVPTKP